MAKFVVVTLGIIILLFLVLIFGYGSFLLSDTIVPAQGMLVDEWLKGYNLAGVASCIVAFVCAAAWYFCGCHYTGGSGIDVTYWGILIASFILGAAVALFIIPSAQEGRGLSFVFVTILPVIAYYLSSLFASAAAVKYIPPLSEIVHR